MAVNNDALRRNKAPLQDVSSVPTGIGIQAFISISCAITCLSTRVFDGFFPPLWLEIHLYQTACKNVLCVAGVEYHKDLRISLLAQPANVSHLVWLISLEGLIAKRSLTFQVESYNHLDWQLRDLKQLNTLFT